MFQYYKDENFLTLYAFISLDIASKPEHFKEREQIYTQLLPGKLSRTSASRSASSVRRDCPSV